MRKFGELVTVNFSGNVLPCFKFDAKFGREGAENFQQTVVVNYVHVCVHNCVVYFREFRSSIIKDEWTCCH